ERQFGVVTRSQLRREGLSDRQIDRRVAGARLEIMHPNVYRVVGSIPGPRQRAKAATLWLGTDAHLSHLTAGGLLHCAESIDDLYVTVEPENRRGQRTKDLVLHRSRLPARDRRIVDGLPCTSAARTLVDCAQLMDDEALEYAIETARRL